MKPERKISMLDKIAKLIDLKSILSMLLTVFLCWGFANDKISPEAFIAAQSSVMIFYFKKDDGKKEGE